MTISTTTNFITYAGNGATLTFTYPFVADSAADIVVTYTNLVGVATILGPTEYTLVINPPATGQLWGIGGSVTYPIGSSPVPIVVGTFLTITRAIPLTQTVTISNQGAFYPQSVEQGMDVIEMQLQQLVNAADFSIQVPDTDLVPPNVLPPAAARANGYLAFDANGAPEVLFGVVPPTPSSAVTTRKISVSGTTTNNILTSDAFGGVSVYQTGGANSTTLQLPTTLGPYPVFDGSGNAATFNLTVLPPAGKTINGSSSFVINHDYQSATFYNDGTEILQSVLITVAAPAVPVPTRQVFTTGSAATYTTPANCRQLRIRMAGAGGGGGGGGTSGWGDGGSGTGTVFNSIVANPGQGAPASTNTSSGSGGTSGIGSASFRSPGSSGEGGKSFDAYLVALVGSNNQGLGGSSLLGLSSTSTITPSSGGYGGICTSSSTGYSSGGGGAGEYVELIINSPAATYTYTVGVGGAAGTAGAEGGAGGAGGNGIIIVDELY